jgi:hypothetical protein
MANEFNYNVNLALLCIIMIDIDTLHPTLRFQRNLHFRGLARLCGEVISD